MRRRTLKQIEADYRRIKAFVKSNQPTSIKDVANGLGLTTSEVRTSLSKHPRVEKAILLLLDNNREAASKKAGLEHQQEAKENANVSTAKVNIKDKYVLDASFVGSIEFEKKIERILATGGKVILTSDTINELGKMQKFEDSDAMHARHILAMAAQDPEHFLNTLIEDETLQTPDDRIIKYCTDHRETVVLLTADKEMTLKARMYGVEVEFFTRQPKRPRRNYDGRYNDTRNTLLTARFQEGNLLIDASRASDGKRMIRVISNNIEYMDGEHKLKIGDEVYLATKKSGYMTFCHYHITALAPANNCRVVYYKQLRSVSEINCLPNGNYKSFMRDFAFEAAL